MAYVIFINPTNPPSIYVGEAFLNESGGLAMRLNGAGGTYMYAYVDAGLHKIYMMKDEIEPLYAGNRFFDSLEAAQENLDAGMCGTFDADGEYTLAQFMYAYRITQGTWGNWRAAIIAVVAGILAFLTVLYYV